MAFFDDLGKKISQTGQGAMQKTKDLADIAKLNSMISDEEKRINNSYYQIGKMYGQLHAQDHEDCFSPLFIALGDSQTKIEELRNRLMTLKGVFNCPNCGSEVVANAAFCNACGKEIPNAPQKQLNEDTVMCGNCSSAVNKGMKFCTKCGSPMAQTIKKEVKIEMAVAQGAPNCPNCGNQIVDGLAFCTECGAKL